MRRNTLRAGRLALAMGALLACPELVAPYDPAIQFRERAASPPSWDHLLGTDELGRDLLSRLLHGARFSLLAGLAATSLAIGLAFVAGGAAGYFGGLADGILMRVSEMFLALPWLYLLLGVRAFLPLDLPPFETFLLLVGVIGGVGWARPARLIRGVALSARERDYVLAARGFGASELHILRRHVLPECFPVALVQASVLLPRFIMAEATLSFLGLGLREPHPSLGSLLASLQRLHVLLVEWWMLFPAAALCGLLWVLHDFADRLQAGRHPMEDRPRP